MALESSKVFWNESWTHQRHLWHMEKPNPNLLNNIHHLHDGKPQDAGLIFLPMCGKTVDMKYLYDKGYRVYGIEYVEQVVHDFFRESGFDFEKKHDERIGDVYSTADSRLMIVCGDVLKLTPEIMGERAQMVWDRGALSAVDKELRKSYASVMTNLVQPGAKYLLDVIEYDDWYRAGPPRNVPPKLVEGLFAQRFDICVLSHTDVTEQLGDRNFDVSPIFRNIFLMTAKSDSS